MPTASLVSRHSNRVARAKKRHGVQGYARDTVRTVRNGPRNLDSALSEIFVWIQATCSQIAESKYTASGVRRPSALWRRRVL